MSMSYSGGYSSILSERAQPVVPSATLVVPPGGALMLSFVALIERDRGRCGGEEESVRSARERERKGEIEGVLHASQGRKTYCLAHWCQYVL